MTICNQQFNEGMTIYQRQLFAAFDQLIRSKVRRPHFFDLEWHRRARKTTGLINLQIKEACRIPNSKHVYIAPTQVMARNIVWDDPNMLRAYLPDKREMDWKMNEQRMLITFENQSMYKIGGSDEPDSLRGIDAISVVKDEWALCKENVWSEIFRPIITGPLPPQLDKYDVFRWAAFAYTPKGINHASIQFDRACCLGEGGTLPDCGPADKMLPRWFASRLDAELSGILDLEELALCKKEMPRHFYDQEYKCSRITSEQMTFITSEMIYALNQYHECTERPKSRKHKIVSIDPAWGGDVCKIGGMCNYEVVIERDILDKLRNNEVVSIAKVVAQELGTKNFIVDCANDNGVADLLATDEAEYNVQFFNSSYKPKPKEDTIDTLKFANLRAQAYHYTSTLIRSFEAGKIHNRELQRQLPIASRYQTNNAGKLIILPKKDIKHGRKGMNGKQGMEGLGCSPDDADMYVMGCWGTQFIEGSPGEDYNRDYRRHDYAGAGSRGAMDMG